MNRLNLDNAILKARVMARDVLKKHTIQFLPQQERIMMEMMEMQNGKTSKVQNQSAGNQSLPNPPR